MTIKKDTVVSGYRKVKFDKMFSFFIANQFSLGVGVRKIASFFFFFLNYRWLPLISQTSIS